MKQQVKISKVKGNPSNPRIIKNDKFKKLVKSIQEFPEMLKLRPIVVDEDMIVLGGNMRLKASKDAGLKEVWIEIAEGLTEEQKKEFIVKDNVGFGEWEWDILANEWDSVQLAEWGLDVWENQDDAIVEDDDTYTRKIVAPTYEPKNEKPNIVDLFDTKKADELIDKIKEADLSREELMFLSHCALRHTVYDYSKIADFYAHSSKEIQELMEDSALVIIDFDKAIENGYVKLTKDIAAAYEKNGIL
jgi:hypothetical protein|tara:strand:- start:301 stop:1038 length:738 start_codon:yes stop_codon:yes gene_type:complete